MRMNRKFWIVSVVAVVIIAACVLILPFPKKISMNVPAVRKDNSGNVSTTTIAWEGKYLDYLLKQDYMDGIVTVDADRKTAVDFRLDWGIDKTRDGVMCTVGFYRSERDNEMRTWNIYFGSNLDWIAVYDSALGSFVAPASDEAEANSLVQRIREAGFNLGW